MKDEYEKFSNDMKEFLELVALTAVNIRRFATKKVSRILQLLDFIHHFQHQLRIS